jgi:broad specificity phosphatase PhoE
VPFVHLVRHGQAAFATGNYDRLTELGWQQSRWLGEYFAERGVEFARVMTGSLRRQKETALAMLESSIAADATVHDDCLNEYRAREILLAHGHTGGQLDAPEYFRRLRDALHAWSSGAMVTGVTESWVDFGARIDRALRACIADLPREANVLLVTSGGVIGRAVADVLGAASSVAIELNQQVRNTSVTELLIGTRVARLISFNAVPHLERADRRHALTYT